ncbi:MAG: hypothetical protein WDA16_03355 [Candidatus Thermoplasmatota archaeon]
MQAAPATYAWSCSCGDGGAGQSPTREQARLEGQLHMCRAGKMRSSAHAVLVVERDNSAAA